MALFKKRKSTKEKLEEKKKEMNQKKQGKLKARSVKDLTREVKANKKIGERDAARKANKAAGERLDRILNFFTPKKKSTTKGGPGVRSGIKTGGSSKLNKPMSFSETAKNKKPPTATAPKTYKSGKIGTPGMGTRSGIKTGRVPGATYMNRRGDPEMGTGALRSKATPGTSGMGTRSGIKTGKRPGTNKPPTGKGGDKTLMPKTYTIKAGDTLSEIAKKMNTTVSMLKAANNIKDANKIRKGQKIKLYRDANKPTTKPKDTRPRTIAQAQKMGSKFFYDKNGNKKAAVTAAQLKKSGLTLSQWLKKK